MGHYYSYVFDRVEKQWWCLNDHLATKVEEELVMKEALGGEQKSYKSACNLIYISNHIADQITALKHPVYLNSAENTKRFTLPQELSSRISDENA